MFKWYYKNIQFYKFYKQNHNEMIFLSKNDIPLNYRKFPNNLMHDLKAVNKNIQYI